jgi:hypothetical protein
MSESHQLQILQSSPAASSQPSIPSGRTQGLPEPNVASPTDETSATQNHCLSSRPGHSRFSPDSDLPKCQILSQDDKDSIYDQDFEHLYPKLIWLKTLEPSAAPSPSQNEPPIPRNFRSCLDKLCQDLKIGGNECACVW